MMKIKANKDINVQQIVDDFPHARAHKCDCGQCEGEYRDISKNQLLYIPGQSNFGAFFSRKEGFYQVRWGAMPSKADILLTNQLIVYLMQQNKTTAKNDNWTYNIDDIQSLDINKEFERIIESVYNQIKTRLKTEKYIMFEGLKMNFFVGREYFAEIEQKHQNKKTIKERLSEQMQYLQQLEQPRTYIDQDGKSYIKIDTEKSQIVKSADIIKLIKPKDSDYYTYIDYQTYLPFCKKFGFERLDEMQYITRTLTDAEVQIVLDEINLKN